MSPGMIARGAELAIINAFMDRAGDGPRALVLEGEAGIGKSTLWLAGVAAARDRSYRVLESRPAETERTLANVVLGDLFGEVEPDVLATLSPPRRRAFESALLLREAPDVPIDPRALGVAILTLLPALGRGRPLVIAIDDDQWMDPSSAATLQFAFRRLGDRPISLLLSRRSGLEPATALEEVHDTSVIERVAVGPMSLAEVQLLLRRGLEVTLPRPTLARIHDVSAGNPFYALELARVQSADPARDMTRPLAVPRSIEELLGDRLHQLDAPTRRDLLTVAAHGRLPVALARTLQVAPEAIGRASAANVIETEGGVIRFTHPLLASSLYQEAGENQRRDAHRRLAAVVADPVDRGRHLALAADAPDDALAAALESAAEVARDRGLSIAAGELAEHAVRLTSATAAEDRHRRAMTAARMRMSAGEGNRARVLADDVEARASAGRQRAEALILRSELLQHAVGVALLEDALSESIGDPQLQAAIHTALAEAGWFSSLKPHAWSERHARAAMRLAERLDDDGLRANALGLLAVLRFAACDLVLTWRGRTGPAREWLEHRLAEWSDRDEQVRSTVSWYLAIVELWSGRWKVAGGHADQVLDIAVEYETGTPYDRFPSALIAMHRGEIAAALAGEGNGIADGRGAGVEFLWGILGTGDAWSGSPADALGNFALAERASDVGGNCEPSLRFWRADYVEALLQLGRIDEATVLLDEWETAAQRLGRDRVTAAARRCRGLIAATNGNLSDGAELLGEAIELHRAAEDPFGRGRTLLALGMTRRRMRQKRTARETIEAALAAFEELGAESWATTAREELARIGGRQRLEGLSPSELGVATLVAEGRTNREIAAALFLGERTVAGHLTHIYSKLGIRSRTELARTLRQSGGDSAGDAGNIERS